MISFLSVSMMISTSDTPGAMLFKKYDKKLSQGSNLNHLCEL